MKGIKNWQNHKVSPLLEQVNKLKPKESYRHCEARRAAAIQTALAWIKAFGGLCRRMDCRVAQPEQ
jgi:hypothetical protein